MEVKNKVEEEKRTRGGKGSREKGDVCKEYPLILRVLTNSLI